MHTDVLLQTFLVTLIEVLLPILVTVLIAGARQFTGQVKARMSQDQLKFATDLTQHFVFAAEQSGLKDELMKQGAVKKEWVLAQLQAELPKHGISIDIAPLDALVESIVFKSLNSGKA
jgi:hypothetical protein